MDTESSDNGASRLSQKGDGALVYRVRLSEGRFATGAAIIKTEIIKINKIIKWFNPRIATAPPSATDQGYVCEWMRIGK